MYGKGDSDNASPEEVAYFIGRGEDFIERSTVNLVSISKFIAVYNSNGNVNQDNNDEDNTDEYNNENLFKME